MKDDPQNPYKVLTGYTEEELMKVVNYWINRLYLPVGGVSVTAVVGGHAEKRLLFHQAIVHQNIRQ